MFLQTANHFLAGFIAVLLLPAVAETALTNSLSKPTPAKGPLRIHPTNPRYFTNGTTNRDGSPKAVYLTSSPAWNELENGNLPFTGSGRSLQWNPAYWQGVAQKVQYANEPGILAFVCAVRYPANETVFSWENLAQVRLFARNLAARLMGNMVVYSPVADDLWTSQADACGEALRAATSVHLVLTLVRRADESGRDDTAAGTGLHPILPGQSWNGVSDLSAQGRGRFLRGVERRHVPLRMVRSCQRRRCWQRERSGGGWRAAIQSPFRRRLGALPPASKDARVTRTVSLKES